MYSKRLGFITFAKSYSAYIAKNYRSVADPGIQKRKAAFKYAEKDLDLDFDEATFDDMETDFMDISKTHKEHVKEFDNMKERLKYQIIKQKYFKEKYPNFLTWNDKQQIKYLYKTNSEEWTIDRLSESFPALPEVIEVIR